MSGNDIKEEKWEKTKVANSAEALPFSYFPAIGCRPALFRV
ncbi:MAG: hypothetical protein ACLFUZ_02520 [Candidatus Micrarchaeia archaeon]